MKPFPFTFDQLLGDIDRFLANADRARGDVRDAKAKALLEATLIRVRNARKEVETVVPEGVKAYKTALDQMAAEAERVQARIADQRARLAALQAKAAEPPPPPPPAAPPQVPAIDPKLGDKLREELLRLAGRDGPDSPRGPGKDIWQDWE